MFRRRENVATGAESLDTFGNAVDHLALLRTRKMWVHG